MRFSRRRKRKIIPNQPQLHFRTAIRGYHYLARYFIVPCTSPMLFAYLYIPRQLLSLCLLWFCSKLGSDSGPNKILIVWKLGSDSGPNKYLIVARNLTSHYWLFELCMRFQNHKDIRILSIISSWWFLSYHIDVRVCHLYPVDI